MTPTNRLLRNLSVPVLPPTATTFRGLMKHKCRVTHCWTPAASRFAAYCPAHRATKRRHGAPDQIGITKVALTPYLKRVADRIAKNPDSSAWAILDQRWSALTEAAQRTVQQWLSGRPGSRIERAAAHELVKLADDEKGREVVQTTAAMVMMREIEPNRFRSDEAFLIQLSRRVRALTYMNVGESYDHTSNRMKRHYRDLPPKVAILMGHKLATTLGAAGLHIARLEEKERQEEAQEQSSLHSALGNLS